MVDLDDGLLMEISKKEGKHFLCLDCKEAFDKLSDKECDLFHRKFCPECYGDNWVNLKNYNKKLDKSIRKRLR